jgi:colanic acid/amylovoran biosynthesis glycosyltransferase
MRVALVVDQFPAVSETFILDEVVALLEQGCDVHVFGTARPAGAVQHPDVERLELHARTTYPEDPAGGARGRRASWVGQLTGAVRHPGIIARIARLLPSLLRHRRLNVVLGLANARDLPDPRFDVVHCHFGPNGLVGLGLREAGVVAGKVVTTFHGYDVSRVIQDQGAGAYRKLFADGDLFLPVSEHWREQLARLGCDPARTRVHRMGVDVARFEYRPRTLRPGEEIRLLSIARLVPKKGIEYALEAVAALAPAYPIRYDIVGDGPLRGALEARASSLGLASRVSFLGAMAKDEVLQRLRGAHLFVAPSVTDRQGNKEGIPVAIMEAMASGLPVVSTHHSGIPELVQDAVTGRLVPEADSGALAEALRATLDAPAAWERLTAAARQRVESEFNAHVQDRRLAAIFQEIRG